MKVKILQNKLNKKMKFFLTTVSVWVPADFLNRVREDEKWHGVASWTWDAQDETCGICRMAFDGCCPDCKLPGDDCPLIWGVCNHAFHLHCILKWVNSQTSQAHCPMCRREWQFKG
ncbi:hypothetical protein VNO80_26994 [Phaseolus coccineus]|uniref:Anaphase-promoting complex subunit 11 n=1 Tax=Phaseolus coccineus TaxID=3886 RepID=A0AAN9LFS8_PHACN